MDREERNERLALQAQYHQDVSDWDGLESYIDKLERIAAAVATVTIKGTGGESVTLADAELLTHAAEQVGLMVRVKRAEQAAL